MDDPLDDFENKYFFHDVIEYESECHIAILNQFFLCFFILTNDDEVCIPSLSSISLAVLHIYHKFAPIKRNAHPIQTLKIILKKIFAVLLGCNILFLSVLLCYTLCNKM